MFDAEIVSEDTLRLYLNGVDVRSHLECVKCTPLASLQSSPKKKPIVPAAIATASEINDVKSDIIIESGNVAQDNDEEKIPNESVILNNKSKEEILLKDDANTIPEKMTILEDLKELPPKDEANTIPEESSMQANAEKETMLDDPTEIPQESVTRVEDNAIPISENNTTYGNVKEEIAADDNDKRIPKENLLQDALKEETLFEDNTITEKSITHDNLEREIMIKGSDVQINVPIPISNEHTSPTKTSDDNSLSVENEKDTNSSGNLLAEDSAVSNIDKTETSHIVEECKNVDIKKIIEKQLEDVIEKVTTNSTTDEEQVQPTELGGDLVSIKDNTSYGKESSIENERDEKTTDVPKTSIKSSEEMTDSNEATETTKSAAVEPKCDMSSEEIRKSVPANPLAELDIKDNKSIECNNKALSIASTDKEVACNESKLNVETSDIGHSPEKDKIAKETPTVGQNETE